MTDSNHHNNNDSASSLKTKKTKAKHLSNKDSIYARFLDRTSKLGSTDVDFTTDSLEELSAHKDLDQHST